MRTSLLLFTLIGCGTGEITVSLSMASSLHDQIEADLQGADILKLDPVRTAVNIGIASADDYDGDGVVDYEEDEWVDLSSTLDVFDLRSREKQVIARDTIRSGLVPSLRLEVTGETLQTELDVDSSDPFPTARLGLELGTDTSEQIDLILDGVFDRTGEDRAYLRIRLSQQEQNGP